MLRKPPLYALVLAGGHSARMKRDKATLAYHEGCSQLDWTVRLVSPHVERTFVSARPDQATDPLRSKHPLILDQITDAGPIAGIAAALDAFPRAAWLVLACDLPFVDDATLSDLVARRNPRRVATAYRSSSDGLPEPLCAIYEPHAAAAITAQLATGKRCPRRLLMSAQAELLDQPRPEALANVNSTEEYWSALTELSEARRSRRVRVQYGASLREQAGRSDEVVETAACTPAELYAELRQHHALSIEQGQLRLAINAQAGDWSQPLLDGDAVALVPLVEGGSALPFGVSGISCDDSTTHRSDHGEDPR